MEDKSSEDKQQTMRSPEVLNKGLYHPAPSTPVTATLREEDYWQNPDTNMHDSEGDTEMNNIVLAIRNLQIHVDQCNKEQLLHTYSQIQQSDP